MLPTEAACFGGQLQHLLAQPEMQTLLDAAPQAARLLRPLCRMLAVPLPPILHRPGRAVTPWPGTPKTGRVRLAHGPGTPETGRVRLAPASPRPRAEANPPIPPLARSPAHPPDRAHDRVPTQVAAGPPRAASG